MNISPEQKIKLYRAIKITLIAFLVAVAVNFLVDKGNENKQENIISFSGHGEVAAIPDIANVYFTISKESKTVKEAQTLVAQIEKKSLYFLKENNVLEKDIKTTNASFSPKYEYRYDDKQIMMPCTLQYGCPPNTGRNAIVGYTASESITIKVRNTDDVGKIMQGLGSLGVSDLSGPNFAIDNQDGLKAEARKKAIDDAKEKAKVLAKDLGIRLGKITSFNESGNYPVPIYTKTMMMNSATGGSTSAQVPKGENTITSDVTITYEIK
ncbi:MAG: SIMPL domain-containing protein [Patescibacteria group bacterium]